MSKPISADRPRAVIIFNPAAGARRRSHLAKTLDALKRLGVSYEIVETEKPGDAENIAKQAGQSVNEDRPDLIVAAGGDGTIHEVVNGLADTGLPLAIIPLGTANVLAREINLEHSPKAVARTIAHGKPKTIHLGKIEGRGEIADRRFILMAGIGFDAEAVNRINLGLKSVIGRGAYGVSALEEFVLGRHRAFKVTADGETHLASWLVVGNARYYAGGFSVTPDARLTDASLDVCLFQGTGRLDTARFVLSSMAGLHGHLKDVKFIRTQRLIVEGPPDSVVQVDGDIVGHLPATISSDGGKIELIYPPH